MQQKIETIKKRSDFVSISKNNISYYSKSTLILARKAPQAYLDRTTQDFIRVGYTVTKKIGKAVVRNKYKRRYREILRQTDPKMTINHHDYVILARKEILNSSFAKIKKDVEFCLQGIKRKIQSTK